ncbi:MAG TPA: hypothetical protein PKE17_09120, partial [Saprospiraceae bacterium]|nr:hypothetical protein [Saprospiraceae bacterium]
PLTSCMPCKRSSQLSYTPGLEKKYPKNGAFAACWNIFLLKRGEITTFAERKQINPLTSHRILTKKNGKNHRISF